MLASAGGWVRSNESAGMVVLLYDFVWVEEVFTYIGNSNSTWHFGKRLGHPDMSIVGSHVAHKMH